ncbi:hypothetical protein [Paraburkholderia silvatlantica]|uniref:hypothetical protein n=1 Tax=Paraburkholderia silvatlantica TaxID=321895 RepID=UPI0011B3EBF3|nr:hypothetical protein [Paraburkholderia silvatlantica]
MIELSKYRRRASKFKPHTRFSEDDAAHVYVDLHPDGRLEYGLSRADSDNALFLLESLLFLGAELLKLRMQAE